MLPEKAKILVIQTAFLGDAILATALIEKLHARYPQAELHFLLRAGNELITFNNPKLKKTWIWEKRKGKYIHLIKLLREIRKYRFDAVVNVNRFAASGFLTAFSGAAVRIGFDKNPLSYFFTQKIKHEYLGHETERNQKLIAWLSDDKPARPAMYPDKAREEKVKALQGSPYVGIAPASVWFTKQWPAAKWLELMAAIPSQVTIYLLGSPADVDLCQQLKEKAQHPLVKILAGQLDILESAALMRGALMNYVNDSGPMHIASAVNAPTTAIYCSTLPAFGFGPLSDISRIVEIQEPLECRPCGIHGRKSCPKGHFKCAESILISQFDFSIFAR